MVAAPRIIGNNVSGYKLVLDVENNREIVLPSETYANFLKESSDIKDSCTVIAENNINLPTDSQAGPYTLDGYEVIDKSRVLLVGQNDPTQNGIYIVRISGSYNEFANYERAKDFNRSDKITTGVFVPIVRGNRWSCSIWALKTDDPIIIDQDDLNFLSIVDPLTMSGSVVQGINGYTGNIEFKESINVQEEPDGVINTFSLPSLEQYIPGTLKVYLNGLKYNNDEIVENTGDNTFTVSGEPIPFTGDELEISYIKKPI